MSAIQKNSFERFSGRVQENSFYSYSFAFFIVLAASLIQFYLEPFFKTMTFLLLYPAVFIVAVAAGFYPAIFSIVLSIVAGIYFVCSPIGHLTLTFEDGARILIFGLFTSLVSYFISEGQEVTKDLRESENLFESTFSLTAIGMAQVSIEGKWLKVNKRVEEITGYSSEELLHMTFAEITHPEDIKLDWDQAGKLIAGEIKEYSLEKRYIGPTKNIVWVNIRVSLKLNEQNTPEYFIVSIDDISEKKKAEEALNEALRVRDEFASVTSHELKTPLSSLRLAVQMIKRLYDGKGNDLVDSTKVLRLVDQTDKQISRLVSLVDDMLDVSRIQAGKFHLNKEVVDLKDLLDKILAWLLPALNAEVELTTPGSVFANVDPFRVEQVIINLLTNAAKYGNSQTIRVELKSTGTMARISVEDKGAGIQEEDLRRIFDRFERVSDRNSTGLGLGLYISKNIIEAHGGKLWATSTPGVGSIFYVELPLTSGLS